MNIGRPQRTTRSASVSRWLPNLLVLTGLGLAARAQQPAAASARPAAAAAAVAAAPRAVPSTKEAEPPASNSAGHQGIRVHGHWVLQVKNPDGTLGERREFENSLVTDLAYTSGNEYLVGLLSGDLTPGDPGIGLIAETTDNPNASNTIGIPVSEWCISPGALSWPCYVLTTSLSPLVSYANGIAPSGQTNGTFRGISTGLTIQATFGATATSGSLQTIPAWTLSGNFTVPSGVEAIWAVQTLTTACAPASSTYVVPSNLSPVQPELQGTVYDRNADYNPQQCSSTAFSGGVTTEDPLVMALTSTVVADSSGNPSPLTVSPGRIVQVTVTITFS